MAFTSLAARIGNLPLILAGPLVRHIQPDQVTVWVALKAARTVTLRVTAPDAAAETLLTGVARSLPLGPDLHVVAVTATPADGDAGLDWGGLYLYNLHFTDPTPPGQEPVPAPDGAPGLGSEDILVNGDPEQHDPIDRLLYPTLDAGGDPTGTPRFPLPSFVLPPPGVGQLSIVHGSCRKPHGEGVDMLSLLDTLIGAVVDQPLERPPQLLLTGDQIYADDVADALLTLLRDAETSLLGWTETLPDVAAGAEALNPGRRQDLVEEKAQFTSDDADSHLLTFGEFCAMYTFAWSPVPWPGGEFASLGFDDFFPGEAQTRTNFWGSKVRTDLKERFDEQKPRLDRFLADLKAVRRALANISSYMMFDDHEVTDDWFLNLDWCLDVLGTGLGRRVINNGLLAFAVFQAWGNTPDRFHDGTPGAALLGSAANWQTEHVGQTGILDQLGVPEVSELATTGNLWPDVAGLANVLRFDYVVDGPPILEEVGGTPQQRARAYRVFVLNSRTGRKFTTDDWFFNTTPGWLLGPTAFDDQLNVASIPEAEKCELAVIVSPAPVVGVPWVETVQDILSFFGAKAIADYEYWGLQEEAVHTLFSRVARLGRTQPDGLETQAIVLCGDVHYGFGARIVYGNTTSDPAIRATIAQFTASSIKNQDRKTSIVHKVGYSLWGDTLPEPDGEQVGGGIDSGACYQPAFILMEPTIPDPPPGVVPATGLARAVAVAKTHQFYADEWANGKETVGFNNLGVIRIEANGDGKPTAATQVLYWRPEGELLQTVYPVSFAFENPECD
jgi:hypothetical protein